jgi:hypothetical protein
MGSELLFKGYWKGVRHSGMEVMSRDIDREIGI